MTSSERGATLTVYRETPFNAGTPVACLADHFTTPQELFFARSHGPSPSVELDTYRLNVNGDVGTVLTLTLDDLRRHFPREAISATLQCAGNRRAELMTVKPIPGQTPWKSDAISTATWTGVPLRAVLEASGVGEGVRHVAFTGLDTAQLDGHSFQVGSSIPLGKALAPEVVLAYEMNGMPLPVRHGAPLRVIVPGYVGIRSIKWLAEIRLRSEPSASLTQAHDYKLFPPSVDQEHADWDAGLMLGELSLTSAICSPPEGAVLDAGPVRIAGYAMAGGDRDIARVDLSTDGGETWETARIRPDGSTWTWRLWECTINLRPGSPVLAVRAYDTAANTQPEDLTPLWNFAGYMNNAWHRVVVHVR